MIIIILANMCPGYSSYRDCDFSYRFLMPVQSVESKNNMKQAELRDSLFR